MNLADRLVMTSHRSIFRHAPLWLCSVAAAAAQSPQDLQAIVQAATSAVSAAVRQVAPDSTRLHIEVSPPDPRLRLPACTGALQARLAASQPAQERQLVTVSCPVGARWQVNLAVRVTSEQAVLVARRPLARGAPFSAADFSASQSMQAGIAADKVRPADRLAGRRLRRAIAAGTVLTTDMLEPDLSVRRGQQVVLLARGELLDIRSSGIALQDGRPGDRVRVQNPASQRVVEGVAGEDATVLVQP